jgi:hypothetical protein
MMMRKSAQNRDVLLTSARPLSRTFAAEDT